MKLTQRNGSTLNIFEIGNSSLRITEQGLLKRTSKEISFQDIQMQDLYELNYPNKYALGYVFVSVTFLVHFATETALNPKTGWMATAAFGALTILAILRYYINPVRINIPTTDQGMIKLFKRRPYGKKVREFIYVLEGKANLAAKKQPAKEDLSHFLRKD